MSVIDPNNDTPRTDMSAIQADLNRIMSRHDKAIRQVDNNVLSEDDNEPQRRIKCQCGENVAVFQVKKEGRNKGRLFASCGACNRFQWCDMPICPKCGERTYKAQSRANGKNAGRSFMNCPNRCQGSFRWLD